MRLQKNGLFSFSRIKDIVILSIGSFGLSFMLSVYSLTVPRLLVENHIPSTLLNISIFSELLFFAMLLPFFVYIFDVTRTAIGRRTPYLLMFGIASAFLVTFIQKNPHGSLVSVLSFVILFNFSLFLYSLSFFGLVSDKTTYQTRLLLPLHLLFWGFFGVIVGYFYMLNSENIELGIETPVSGFVYLLSALVVSFFVIEDKKYKTKLSKTERGEYSFRLKNLLDLSDFGKEDFINLLILGVVYSHEIFIVEFLRSYPFKKVVITQFVFVISVGLAYCMFICSKKINEFSQKSRSVVLTIVALIYFLYSFSNSVTILLLQFLVGLLWGIILPKTIGFIIPSRSERMLFYNESMNGIFNKPKEESLRLFLLLFTILTVLGLVTDAIGMKNLNLLYSSISLAILVLNFVKKTPTDDQVENDSKS